MNDIDFWRLADELTLIQAALLITGYDPTDYQEQAKSFSWTPPKGYIAVKHALHSAVASGKMSLRGVQQEDDRGHMYTIDDEAMIPVEAIKDWLREKGVEEHFFFLPNEPKDEFLSEDHPRYSAKLAAAVTAWRAFEDEALIKGSVKQSAMKWLRIHAVQYGLSDEDGKPAETAIAEIAKVINWDTKGGAPKTQNHTGWVKGAVGSKKASNVSEALSVKKQKVFDESVKMTFDLDEEIPF